MLWQNEKLNAGVIVGFDSFQQVEELFQSQGVKQIYVKHLSKKQDNDKNQIYLGKGIGSITNILPTTLSLRSASESMRKRRSKRGRYKIEAKLDFEWFAADGQRYPSPDAKIIDYFQYPEVRMSGFLTQCVNPPDALRRRNQLRYGKRILILGANPQGKTFGLLLTELEDPLVTTFPILSDLPRIKILRTHILGGTIGSNPRDLLVEELTELSGIWHPSITLKPGDEHPVPFKGNQGAGFTLEALLNVPRNAKKEPDKHGFEIKSFKRGGKISLMTPTADTGQEGDLSFRDFMDKFGWIGKKGDGRIVFNGVHRYQKICASTGYSLEVLGFEPIDKKFIEETKDITVCLIDPDSELMVSGWTFDKLLNCWSKKHASACYVEYEKRSYAGEGTEHDSEYRYTGKIYLGGGTSIFNYLMSIISKVVFYDAGHEISADGSTHQRPQWRISVTKKLIDSLKELYDEVEELSVT